MATTENGEQNPGGAAASTGQATDTSTQTQNAPGGGQQPVAGGQGGGSERSYSYKEDRSDWVPRHRIAEVQSKAEKRYEELAKRFERLEGGLKSSLGVDQPSAQDQEAEQVKQWMLQQYPHLGVLSKIDPEKLEQLLGQVETLGTSAEKQQEIYAEQSFTDAESQLAKGMGVAELTQRQKMRFREAIVAEATRASKERNAAYKRGDESYDFGKNFLTRYERGDKSLLSEFVKDYLEDTFEPGRRASQASIMNRNRPLPSGARTRTAVTNQQPAVNLNNEDEFKKALLAARNSG